MIWKIIRTPVLLFILVLSSIVFLVTTETGLNTAVKVTQFFYPDLSIGKAAGRLLGHITLQDVQFKKNNLSFYLQKADIDSVLHVDRLEVKKIVLENITVLQHPFSYVIANADATGEFLFTGQYHFDVHIQKSFINHPLLKKPILGATALTISNKNIDIHPLNLSLNNNNINIVGKINKQWDLAWKIELTKLDAIYSKAQGTFFSDGKIQGELNHPVVNIRTTSKKFSFADLNFSGLDNTIFIKPNGETNLQFSLKKLKWEDYKANDIQLSAIGTLLNHHIKLQGNLFENLITMTATGHLEKDTWQTHVQQLDIKNSLALLHLRRGFDAKISEHEWQVDPACLFLKDSKLCIDGRGKEDKNSFHFVANQFQLANLPSFFSKLESMHGLVNLNLTTEKNQKKIVTSGEGSVKQGNFYIPDLHISPKDINLNFTAKDNILKFNGQATTGKNTFHLNGTTDLANLLFSTHSTLTGENLLLSDTGQYRIVASPQVKINYLDHQLGIDGTIFIPEATISPMDFDQQTKTLSSDVVYVKKGKPIQADYILPIVSNIKLMLGDNINLHTANLTGKLSGNLQLRDAPNQPTTATGNLYINDGVYKYYGQKLKIRPHSSLSFAGGPVDNPGMNIQAFREITEVSQTNNLMDHLNASATPLFTQSKKITVGINVDGTLKNLKISLFSEPGNLSQTDILSYLVLGHAANKASLMDSKLLLDAAVSLNKETSSGSIQRLVDQLQKRFGLDSMNVETTTTLTPGSTTATENTALVLGKTLSPKLYVSYSIGLANPGNAVQVRYSLSKNLTVQSSASTFGDGSTGADLIYSIEKS